MATLKGIKTLLCHGRVSAVGCVFLGAMITTLPGCYQCSAITTKLMHKVKESISCRSALLWQAMK